MNTEQIVRLADAYATHKGLKRSTISTYVTNDGKTFDRLAGGGNCTLRRARLVLVWFADHWPADLEWPHDIPRPSEQKDVA